MPAIINVKCHPRAKFNKFAEAIIRKTLNFELFITRRVIRKGKYNLSAPAIRIAVLSIALGLAVMIVSLAILTGFQREIREKVAGFTAHITITSYDFNKSLESSPILMNQPFYPHLDTVKGISHIQVFAMKGGIIKTDDQIEGVIVKGVGGDHDWSRLEKWLVEGRMPDYSGNAVSNDILLSVHLVRRLGFSLGDDLRMYFVTEGERQPRGRKFTIAGIYNSGLEDFDARYVFADIGHIRRLNNWPDDMVSGFEVLVDDFSRLDRMGEVVKTSVGYYLMAETVKEREQQIFEWLQLQDMNVVVIVVLMLLVAGFSIISALLILILEKIGMIGILKALGTRNRSIKVIFIFHAIYITAVGMFWGNVAGIGLCLLQVHFELIPLPVESYYVSTVPINLSVINVVLLNLGTILLCTFMLLLPSDIISRISPLRAIRMK